MKAVKSDSSAITFEKTGTTEPTPSVEPSEEPTPSVEPSEEPTPSVEPSEEPAPSVAPVDGINPKVEVTTNHSGNISQVYSITNGGTKAFDLSKLTIRYNYSKDGNKAQQFWCDSAGLSLSTAPYYVNYSSNVKGTFGDGYLELSFDEVYMIDAGTLNVQVRWNQEDWSSYTNFKEGNVEVYYDGQLIK